MAFGVSPSVRWTLENHLSVILIMMQDVISAVQTAVQLSRLTFAMSGRAESAKEQVETFSGECEAFERRLDALKLWASCFYSAPQALPLLINAIDSRPVNGQSSQKMFTAALSAAEPKPQLPSPRAAAGVSIDSSGSRGRLMKNMPAQAEAHAQIAAFLRMRGIPQLVMVQPQDYKKLHHVDANKRTPHSERLEPLILHTEDAAGYGDRAAVSLKMRLSPLHYLVRHRARSRNGEPWRPITSPG